MFEMFERKMLIKFNINNISFLNR